MSSVVRACVRRSLAYVCLSYVQPSRGKTFAYLRSFALLYERTSSSAETNRARVKEKSKERTIHTHTYTHIPPILLPSESRTPFTSVRHPPPLFAKRDLPEKRAFYLGPSGIPRYTPGINRLSGESNLSDGLALSNAPT